MQAATGGWVGGGQDRQGMELRWPGWGLWLGGGSCHSAPASQSGEARNRDLDVKSLAFLSSGKEFKIFRSTLHGTHKHLSGCQTETLVRASVLMPRPTSLTGASSGQARLGTGRG